MVKPSFVVGGIGILLIAILGWRLLAAHERIGDLKTKLATQVEATEEAADANDSNIKTINELRAEIDSMIEQRKADAEQREAVIRERERELEAARALARRLQIERDDETETNLQCAEYNKLVMADFCPAAARQLRERSSGTGSDQDGSR